MSCAAALARLPDDELDLDAIERADLVRLRYACAGAYYLSVEVRRRLGDHTEEPEPVRLQRVPDYLTDGLLDHLLADG